MFMVILGVIILVVTAFVIIVAIQPAVFRVSRSATIAAPASGIFPHVNEFRKWTSWSPWEKLDPNLGRTYEGPEGGEGAKYAWKGNKQVGEGRMTITQSTPNERIGIRLEFLKPFAATNQTEFLFKEQGGQTTVDWTMTGEKNFVMKAFCMFMNMDKMVGKDFEKGLAGLKAVSEGSR